MGAAVSRCSRRCDSHGTNRPHPALHATFSHLREKATDCQRCSGVAPTPPFPPSAGDGARRADGGLPSRDVPAGGLSRHQPPSSGAARHLLPPAGEGNGLPALQRLCTNPSLPPPAGEGARRADGGNRGSRRTRNHPDRAPEIQHCGFGTPHALALPRPQTAPPLRGGWQDLEHKRDRQLMTLATHPHSSHTRPASGGSRSWRHFA